MMAVGRGGLFPAYLTMLRAGVGTTVVCALYLWPALRAWRQGERQRRTVLGANLFLGWAIFGWWRAWDLACHPSVPDLFPRKGQGWRRRLLRSLLTAMTLVALTVSYAVYAGAFVPHPVRPLAAVPIAIPALRH